jgi:serine/threonine-protein kinase RsbW
VTLGGNANPRRGRFAMNLADDSNERLRLRVESGEIHPSTLLEVDSPPFELARSVSAVADQIAGIRHSVLALAEAHGMTNALQADVALAVSEACANVVMHAYVDAPGPGPMTVAAYHDNSALVVIITDDGSGMVPRPHSPGLGVGLSLIARLTQGLEISNPTPRGTKVQMTFTAAVA